MKTGFHEVAMCVLRQPETVTKLYIVPNIFKNDKKEKSGNKRF